MAFALRLGRGGAAAVGNMLLLLRVGRRDAKTLRRCRRELLQARVPLRRPRLGAMALMVGQYAALLRRLPTLAGGNVAGFQQYLIEQDWHFNGTLPDPPPPAATLKGNAGRALQGICIDALFIELFEIQLLDKQRLDLSIYQDCDRAIADFLMYCRASNRLVSREDLLAALADFAAQLGGVNTRLKKGATLDRSDLNLHSVHRGGSVINPLIFRPAHVLTRLYWGQLKPDRLLTPYQLPTWATRRLVSHLGKLAEQRGLSVRDALACDMHVSSCLALAAIFDGLDGASANWGSISELDGENLLRNALDELQDSLMRARGHPTHRTPLLASLTPAR